MIIKKYRVVFGAIVGVFLNSSAFGGGFRVYSQSTSSTSQGDAMVAHYEDASTMFYNAAAITKTPTSQLLLDYLTFTTVTKFSNEEIHARAKTLTFHIPHLYFLYKFNEKVAAGIATVFPYGLARDWPEDWGGRYLITKAGLTTYTINPNVAVQVLPSLSLGGGFSYMMSDVELRQKVDSSSLLGGAPADDIGTKLEGDGDGWGFNLGAFLDITKNIHLGISYRSQIEVDYDGEANFDIPASAAVLAPTFPDQGIKTNIKFPAVLVFGISYHLFDNLDLEVNADWTDWSSYDSLVIKYEDGSKTSFPKKYRDAWVIHFGGRYRPAESLLMRLGYYYDMTPVPSESVDPMVPGADKHGLSLGIRYSFPKFALNLGYQGVLFEHRRTSNNRNNFNGKYESMVHVAGVSCEYNF